MSLWSAEMTLYMLLPLTLQSHGLTHCACFTSMFPLLSIPLTSDMTQGHYSFH